MTHVYNDLPGAGTTIAISIASTMTIIPGASEIDWSGFKQSTRNPTALNSGHVRKKPGLPDFGQVKFKVWLDPNNTTHIALRDRVTNGTPTTALDSWQIVYADGSTSPAQANFLGFISEFAQSGIEPETGTLIAEVTVEVDSVTSFVAGNPSS
jgi:hypothetical protein